MLLRLLCPFRLPEGLKNDLDGYLTQSDNAALDELKVLYDSYLEDCRKAEEGGDTSSLVRKMKTISKKMKEITGAEDRIHVYSFESPKEQHAEASRLIAHLRDPETTHEEFVYYIQRAYELLFTSVFTNRALSSKRQIIQKTGAFLKAADNPEDTGDSSLQQLCGAQHSRH